jgi:hypothetical protein
MKQFSTYLQQPTLVSNIQQECGGINPWYTKTLIGLNDIILG